MKLKPANNKNLSIEIKYEGRPASKIWKFKGWKIEEDEIFLSFRSLWHPLFLKMEKHSIKAVATVDKKFHFFGANKIDSYDHHSKAIYQFKSSIGILPLIAGKYRTYEEKSDGIIIEITTEENRDTPHHDMMDWSFFIYRYCQSLFGETDEKILRMLFSGNLTASCYTPGICTYWPHLILLPEMSDGFSRDAIAHEIAHLWWGLSVQIDPFEKGVDWIIEGLPQYVANSAYENYYEKKSGLFKTFYVRDPIARTILSDQVAFEKDLSSYHKGYYFFEIMNLILGEEKANEMLKKIYQNLKNKKITLEDIKRILAEELDVDHYQKLEDWIMTEKVLDLKIEKMNNDSYLIKNVGDYKIDGPIEILYIYQDKSTDIVPGEISKGECIKEIPENIQQIYVDPFCRWPDYNLENKFLFDNPRNLMDIYRMMDNEN